MKRKLLLVQILLMSVCYSFGQGIGIGTTSPNSSAILDITHTSKGVLIPRMSTTAINNIANPAKGLFVYDSSAGQLKVNKGTPTSPNWQNVAGTATASGWSLTGNSGTTPATQFIGTTDNQPLRFRVNNASWGELNATTGNIYWGLRAGQNPNNIVTTGNIAIGTDAGRRNVRNGIVAIGDSALFNNGDGNPFPNTGIYNTAVGSRASYANHAGSYNTAVGYHSLTNNGYDHNTAVGAMTLAENVYGSGNTAIGAQVLAANDGSYNTGVGARTLMTNTTGYQNTSLGMNAMQYNTTGAMNTVIGAIALRMNTAGSENISIGNGTMYENRSGGRNTAVGTSALGKTTDAYYNTAVGFYAGLGYNLGWNNTFVGANADASFEGQYNVVAIGQGTNAPDNSTARIGNTATWSIGGYAGWSNFSDGRFKRDVHENVKGLDFIMKLRPVTYRLDINGLSKNLKENRGEEWNEQMRTAIADKEKVVYTGFVAQEVEQAAKQSGFDFSGVDKPRKEGNMYALRYAEFVVPLVKAVQEQQQIINDLMKRIEKLEALTKTK